MAEWFLSPQVRAERRAALVARFAVIGPDGRALRHGAEGYYSADRGSEGKVILVSQCYARRLAGALLHLGEDPQEEYVCDQGHWHLRQIEKNRAGKAKRRQR